MAVAEVPERETALDDIEANARQAREGDAFGDFR